MLSTKFNYIWTEKGITLITFLVTLVFFTNIHPVTIISGDDWGNFSSSRSAYPEWQGFNPIKVIPETIMPYSGFIASSIIRPIFGTDFLFSISIITAIIVSSLTAILFNELFKFINKHLGIKKPTAFLSLIIVFLYIFSFLKSKPDSGSSYLLWEINITCYYHYIIPALINTAFSFYLLRINLSIENLKRKTPLYLAWIFTATYACIFSNIFHSIIIASTCTSLIMIKTKRSKNINNFLNENTFYFFVLFLWIISVFFEANGNRASGFSENNFLLQDSISRFFSILKNDSNKLYRNLLAACWLIGIVTVILSKKNNQAKTILEIVLLLLFSGAMIFSFVMLVCAKSSPSYTERPAAMWGIYMYAFIATAIVLCWVSEKHKIIISVLPIIIFILACKAAAPNTSLKESHNLNLTYDQAYKVTNSIINQVINADQKGEKNITLLVPKGDDNDNWPFPVYMGSSIYYTLKSNRIISNKITISIKPDINENIRLGIE